MQFIDRYYNRHYHYFISRKRLFDKVHYFVHLNLAFTLLLANLVFVSGIETATVNEVQFLPINSNSIIFNQSTLLIIDCLCICGCSLTLSIPVCFLLDAL
jgi:hypothetical protein